eukprot:scaffold19_cov95-Skeletonema_dohrnii-CCMP3373.AAC.4
MTFQESNQPSTASFTPAPVNSTKKRVRMNPTVLVQEFSVQPLTEEEKSELYYTRNAMNNFILDVKDIAYSHKLTQTMYKTDCIREQDNVAVESDGFLRGIELQIYPQRAQNKLIARRALLKYQTYLQTQRTNITPEQKATAMRAASEKLSAWSHKVARETARLDSIRAYDAEYLIPLDDQQVEFTPFPELTFKRKASFQEEVRRVTPEPEDPPRPLFKKARAAIRAAA